MKLWHADPRFSRPFPLTDDEKENREAAKELVVMVLVVVIGLVGIYVSR